MVHLLDWFFIELVSLGFNFGSFTIDKFYKTGYIKNIKNISNIAVNSILNCVYLVFGASFTF